MYKNHTSCSGYAFSTDPQDPASSKTVRFQPQLELELDPSYRHNWNGDGEFCSVPGLRVQYHQRADDEQAR